MIINSKLYSQKINSLLRVMTYNSKEPQYTLCVITTDYMDVNNELEV